MAKRERIEAGPPVSIVTINYNQTEVTCDFLASAKRLTYPNIEIIVVDNASAVNPAARINPRDYPGVQLIVNAENLGFTGGNNVGIDRAKGDFIFIVNNDTELTPNLIELLLEPFQHDDKIGVVCPKIRFHSQPDVIQYAGYGRLNYYTGQVVAVGTHELDRGQYDRSGPTHFAHGCAMMVKREVIEKVGRFAERFFLYYEELDWSLRILKAGYVIYYQAAALIYHKESLSVGKASPLKVYYLTRNRILLMRRHTNGLQKIIFYLFFTVFVSSKHILRYALKNQRQFLKAYLRGVLWNFRSSSQSPV